MSSPTLAPGARVVVRDEEWLVRRAHKASPGGKAVEVVGVSELVRGKEAIFLTDLDEVTELAPEKTGLATDDSPQYRKTRLPIAPRASPVRRPGTAPGRRHLGVGRQRLNAPCHPGPAARHGHAMIYDSQRARVVLFGGSTGSDPVPGDT